MTVVKGPGGRFYDVPQSVLEQYVVNDQNMKKLRTKAVKMTTDELEDQEVEGYGSFLYDYEGFGYVCGFPHNVE